MLQQIKKALRLVNGSARKRALILLYHRVGDLPGDVYQLTVSPRNFSEQLDYLKDKCVPMSVHELVTASQQGSLPDKAVAITFDDGYVDNFTNAFPILENAKVPATIFITTGNVDSSAEFWWDRLEGVMLQDVELPDSLRLEIEDTVQEWPMSGSTNVRQISYRQILRLLRSLNPEKRMEKLAEIERWAGLEPSLDRNRAEYRTMTSAEIREINECPYIELGAHTITHPLLSNLSYPEQFKEISESKEKLAVLLANPVRYFSYPFGDYNSDTVSIVSKLGFNGAVTTQSGGVQTGSDRFLLNRCAVRDWDKLTFSQQLENYFNDDHG